MPDTDTLTDEIVATFGDETFDAKNPPAGMLRAVKFPTLMYVNKRTMDGRRIEKSGFDGGEFPHPFMFQFTFQPAHLGSNPVGRFDKINVLKSGKVEAFGWILDNDEGQRAALLIETKSQRGVSVDLGVSKYEVRWNEKTEKIEFDFLETTLTGVTGVAFPAFADAKAAFDDLNATDLAAAVAVLPDMLVWDVDDDESLNITASYATDDLAAAAGVGELVIPTLKAAHHQRPATDGLPFPLRVTTDGRVQGWVATWGQCHIGIDGKCITPPRSRTGYALFATRLAPFDDGEDRWVGPLVLGAKHAPGELDYEATAEYYGNACRAWADVTIGEDEHGIWVSGSVRPGTSEDDIRAGMLAAVSGHWKPYKGSMEMIAILSVNAPGFPVPRPRAGVAAAGVYDLTAAGVLEPELDASTMTSPEVAVLVKRVDALLSELENERARREAQEIAASLG